jgi:hypothetical protein
VFQLAAFGTIGIAVAGLALGAGEETLLLRPGKRKSPGSDGIYTSSPSLPPPARRVVSESATQTLSTPTPGLPRSFSSSLFRRKSPIDPERASTSASQNTQSRGSSQQRNGLLHRRPFSAVDEDDERPQSSWKRRLSTMSSLNYNTSPASSTHKLDLNSTSNSTPGQRRSLSSNRLVKRATSQRLMSADGVKGSLFRRPATSHQRSSSMMALSASDPAPTLRDAYLQQEDQQDQQDQRPESSASIFRPFFSSGYARKRYGSAGPQMASPNTVATPYSQQATLVSPRAVQRHNIDDDQTGFAASSAAVAPPNRQKLKRSLSSFRRTGRTRYFTEPSISLSNHNAHGSIIPSTRSPLSPVSRSSTFDIDLPPGTPIFASSPPLIQAPRANPSINKRVSAIHSEVNTASSDNDTRLFSDDDSMDFQSDTAYDSLATRATVSSQSGYRQPKIETIFDESNEHVDGQVHTLEALMQQSTLDDSSSKPSPWQSPVGIGIQGWDDDDDQPMRDGDHLTLTPVKEHPFGSVEELNATPMPLRRVVPTMIGSSPPASVIRHPHHTLKTPSLEQDIDMDVEDEDSIDWSPKSNHDEPRSPVLPSNSPIARRQARLMDISESESKRSSIFDWSENQVAGADIIPRPKTVHGKHANEQNRSRASGRKGPSAVHLRSQSVPVNRDNGTDPDLPAANAKFNTWGLGKKGVSEEWSDDFEFDDIDEPVPSLPVSTGNNTPGPRDSIRSVKVPQAIIDRQASVHQQFSQVQEFMSLVEELKRLRTQGLALGILESKSPHLWIDAENIINLATLNDEDEEPFQPHSPTSSDIFGEDASPNGRRISLEDNKRDSLNVRSFSGIATPPSATRPRGESLLQAKSFLQTIHQNRGDSASTNSPYASRRDKLPFNTQDLRELVAKTGVITRDLKEVVRRAEGVNISPQRTPQQRPPKYDPTLGQLFNPPSHSSPLPNGMSKPGLPKSRSANSYLSEGVGGGNENTPFNKLTMIEV